LQAVAPGRLPTLARALARPNKKLLAEKVETVDEFKTCMALGFEYFQGYYFARPVILSGKKISPSDMVILHLLELINSEADNRVIELAVKRDALISLNLLRLVNTPVAGGRGHFDTLAKALMVLGRRQLQRWLQILLYAAPGRTVTMSSPLLQMAITRGKLLELMALKVLPGRRGSADLGFTVGIMSLMDALFSMPMRDILASVSVPDEVREALLEREGDFGQMLNIVGMLENASGGEPLMRTLCALDLTVKQIREIELAAFEWVNELEHDVH
jgi:EAL and modified HD-GYP domain-containing signal transduction protein